MFYVYVLKSKRRGSYYVGSCSNVAARLTLHNAGKVHSTARYRPWEVAYVESYDTLVAARKRELQIKHWKKRAMIEKLIKTFQNVPIADPR